MCQKSKLEIQAETKDERDWAWIHVVIDTIRNLGIDAIILGDAEHVRNSTINTSAQAVITTVALEEVAEAVTQSDVVALEERSVLNPAVAEL